MYFQGIYSNVSKALPVFLISMFVLYGYMLYQASYNLPAFLI